MNLRLKLLRNQLLALTHAEMKEFCEPFIEAWKNRKDDQRGYFPTVHDLADDMSDWASGEWDEQ